jgi:hypothetical protein
MKHVGPSVIGRRLNFVPALKHIQVLIFTDDVSEDPNNIKRITSDQLDILLAVREIRITFGMLTTPYHEYANE